MSIFWRELNLIVVRFSEGLTAKDDAHLGLAHTGRADHQQTFAIEDPAGACNVPDPALIEWKLGLNFKDIQGYHKQGLEAKAELYSNRVD